MANLILAVIVGITLLHPTEVAVRNDFVTNTLGQTLIEDEVGTVEFIREALLFDLMGIIDDTSFEVSHVSEAIVLQPGTRLLTTNTAGAI